MTAFIVNTPDLVDAVRKASRIAPKRGHAFDVAAGVQFSNEGGALVVKASDLDTHYRQEIVVPALNEFDPFRVPSAVLAGWVAHLPTGESSQTTVAVDPATKKAKFVSETSKAEFSLILGDSFPKFAKFDVDELTEVEGLGQHLRRVSWACHKDSVPLCGVHIDGERLVGCDTARMAEVLCSVPVDHPVTAPLTGVANALSGHLGAVGLAVKEGRLHLAPDAETQITTTLYEVPYPNVERLRTITESNVETTVDVGTLKDALARISSISARERYPLVTMRLDGTSMRFQLSIAELGDVEELFEFNKGLDGDSINMMFTPGSLLEMANASTSATLTIAWPEDLSGLKPIRVTDGQGFTCIAMPRRPL